jgi:type II secretory pathway pseudopilin PulG
MQTYHIYLNEQIQGPYSKAEIETRIRDRSIDSTTQIAVDGGGWVGVTDVFPSLFPTPDTNLVGSVAVDSIPSNPYTPPITNTPLNESIPVVKYEGIGRLAFAGAAFAILLVGSLYSVVSDGSPIPGIVAGLVMMIPASSRLKNIGSNPAWCFLLLVPLLGLFVTVPCFLLPPGYQQHRRIDLAAKILGCVFTTLLLILAAAVFAVVIDTNAKVKRITALVAAAGIESAVNDYITEYGRMPSEGSSDTTLTTSTDIGLLEVLLGLEDKLNTRSIEFLSVRQGKENKNGLIYTPDGSGVVGLYDPWGGGYRIRLDLDCDEKVDVGSETLDNRRVAVWSDGPDRKAGTKDDVKTW